MAEKTRNLCAEIPLELHTKVRQRQAESGETLSRYMTALITKYYEMEENVKMDKDNVRTVAFQVPTELFEQLKSEMDEDKRADLIFQMQQILVDDAAVLIDGYYNSSMNYSKNVGNAHIHTADYYWLTTEITPAQ